MHVSYGMYCSCWLCNPLLLHVYVLLLSAVSIIISVIQTNTDSSWLTVPQFINEDWKWPHIASFTIPFFVYQRGLQMAATPPSLQSLSLLIELIEKGADPTWKDLSGGKTFLMNCVSPYWWGLEMPLTQPSVQSLFLYPSDKELTSIEKLHGAKECPSRN